MDKMLSRYTTKRLTQSWPLVFFYNILDATCLATYILCYENNKVLPKIILTTIILLATGQISPRHSLIQPEKKKITGVRHVCLTSEFKKRHKLKNRVRCEFPICNEHCVSTTTCEVCVK